MDNAIFPHPAPDRGASSHQDLPRVPLVQAAAYEPQDPKPTWRGWIHLSTVPVALVAGIILITAVPTAPSATVLASRMGGDTRLMAAITGVQTVLAIVTIPLLLLLAGTLSA